MSHVTHMQTLPTLVIYSVLGTLQVSVVVAVSVVIGSLRSYYGDAEDNVD